MGWISCFLYQVFSHWFGALLSDFKSLFFTKRNGSPILVCFEGLVCSFYFSSTFFFNCSPIFLSLAPPISMLVDVGLEILIHLDPPINLLYVNYPSAVLPSNTFSFTFHLRFYSSIALYEEIIWLYFFSRLSNFSFCYCVTSASILAL